MQPRPRAFTLVELLVVISVLAVLISLLLPAMGEARVVAKRTVCLSNIRQLGIATFTYADQNKNRFPLEDRNVPLDLICPQVFRGDVFRQYNLPIAIWQCPITPQDIDDYSSQHGSMYDCTPPIPNKLTSYMYLGNGYRRQSASWELDWQARPMDLESNLPASTVLMSDQIAWEVSTNTYYVNHSQTRGDQIVASASQAFVDGHALWNATLPALIPGVGGNGRAYHVNFWPSTYWW